MKAIEHMLIRALDWRFMDSDVARYACRGFRFREITSCPLRQRAQPTIKLIYLDKAIYKD